MDHLSFRPFHQLACNSPERQAQKRRKKAKTKSIKITKTIIFSQKRREPIFARFLHNFGYFRTLQESAQHRP